MTEQEKRLNKLASELCLLLSGGKCCVCRTNAPDEPHHLFKRRIERLRWDIRNLFPVCRACHNRVERVGHNEELRLLGVSPERYEELRLISLKINKGIDRIDLDELEAELRQGIAEAKKRLNGA